LYLGRQVSQVKLKRGAVLTRHCVQFAICDEQLTRQTNKDMRYKYIVHCTTLNR